MRYVLLFILSFKIIACSKVGTPPEENNHLHDANDDVFPLINVEKPVNNQQYLNGDTIFIKGMFTDDKKLYKGWIRVINDVTTLVMREQYFETHGAGSIPFDIYYKPVVTSVIDYTVTFEIEDHGFNKTQLALKVRVNP